MNRKIIKRRVDSFNWEGLLTTVADKVGLGDEVQKVTTTLDALKPLQSTMTNALKAAGVTPPTNLTDIVNQFQNVVMKKSGAVTGTATDVLNYVKTQVDSLAAGAALTPPQKATAQGGQAIVDNESISLDGLLSNPFFWMGIAGLILTIILIAKK